MDTYVTTRLSKNKRIATLAMSPRPELQHQRRSFDASSSPSSADSSTELRIVSSTPPRSSAGGSGTRSTSADLEKQQLYSYSYSPNTKNADIRQRITPKTTTTVTQKQQPRRKRRSGRHSNNQQQRSSSTSLSITSVYNYGSSIRKRYLMPPPTVILPVLVLIDMFAVSLVVPLLFQYYKSAGVTSAQQREFLSSIFSISQIVGGLLFGVMTDAKLVQRKTILLLSFGGSAVSYALIVASYAFGGLYAILFSRVLVGLVKQTMTIAATMLANATTKETRATHMGRLKASTTAAWIMGPTAGALLFKHVDVRSPALLACGLFVLNFVLAAVLLVDDEEDITTQEKDTATAAASQEEDDSESGSGGVEEEDDDHGLNAGRDQQLQQQASNSKSTKRRRGLVVIISNIRSCFTSQTLGAVIMTQLIVTWVSRSTSYSQLGSFYEDMYGLEPHHRGYISSYQQLLKFVVNVILIGPVLARAGGERYAICYGTAIMALATWFESQQSLSLFLVVLCPFISLSVTVTDVSIQSLVTHVAPSESIFSVLAALDVLQNAVAVSVPFYRTLLFHLFRADPSKVHVTMEGDPDPVAWVRAGAIHYGVAALVASYLLLSSSTTMKEKAGADISLSPSSPQAKKKKGR